MCVDHVHSRIIGVGKSHYIRQKLVESSHSVTIAVNEGFEPLKAIERLKILPKRERNCAIYFNFNLIPPIGVSMQHCCNYVLTIIIYFYWFCLSCRILFTKKTRGAMTLSWKLSAGSFLTSYFSDMWKTPTLGNPSNYLEAFLGPFTLRLVCHVLRLA